MTAAVRPDIMPEQPAPRHPAKGLDARMAELNIDPGLSAEHLQELDAVTKKHGGTVEHMRYLWGDKALGGMMRDLSPVDRTLLWHMTGGKPPEDPGAPRHIGAQRYVGDLSPVNIALTAFRDPERFRPYLEQGAAHAAAMKRDTMRRSRAEQYRLRGKETTGESISNISAKSVADRLPFSPNRAVEVVWVMQAAKRLAANKDEDYPKRSADIDELERFLDWKEETEARGKTIPAHIASGIAELPAFMVEFAATGGLASAGKKAAVKGATAVTKRVVGKKVLAMAAKFALGGKVRKATTKLAGKLATWTAGGVARSLAMPHRTAEGFAERQVASQVVPTQRGWEILDQAQEKPYVSALRAFGDTVIENMSEESGEVLTKGLGKAAGAVLSKFPKAQAKFKALGAALARAGFTKSQVTELMEKGGFHGTGGEMLEERLGAVMRAVFNIQGDKGNIFERLVKSIPDGQQLLIEGGIFAVPGAMRAAGNVLAPESLDDRMKRLGIEAEPTAEAKPEAAAEPEAEAKAEPEPEEAPEVKAEPEPTPEAAPEPAEQPPNVPEKAPERPVEPLSPEKGPETPPEAQKAEKAAEPEPAAKQPWEMAREEYLNKVADEAVAKVPPDSGAYRYWNEEVREPANDTTQSVGHMSAVRDAISEGKPVPAEVLADYPDLAQPKARKPKKPTKAEAAAPAEGEAIPLAEAKGKPSLIKDILSEESGSLSTAGIEDIAGALGRAGEKSVKDASRGLGAAWRSLVTLPGRALAEIPADNPIGRLRDWAGTMLSDQYGRPKTWTMRKERAKGGGTAAKATALQISRSMSKLFDKAGLDPADPTTHIIMEQALRGDVNVSQLPEVARVWVETARQALDNESRYAAEQFRKAGLDSMAEVYESNIGKYLKNIPKAKASPTAKTKAFIGRLLGPRLTRSWGKAKRDKWILKVRGKVAAKFDSEEKARAAYKKAVVDRKAELVTKRGQKKKWTLDRQGKVPRRLEDGSYELSEWSKTESGVGVDDADLYRKAARQIQLIEPISDKWRLENEIHDPRYLVYQSIVETRHNAEMVRLFAHAADKWGQKAPKGTQAETDAWAADNGLAPLPQTGRLHDLAGMYVPEAIAEDLTEMTRAPSLAWKMYGAYLTAWKSSKTIYNPATHGRNVMGNFVFAFLGRTSPWNPANVGHYYEAIRELYEKGEDFQFLLANGVVGTEYFGAELKKLANGLDGVDPSRIDRVLAGLGRLHNAVGSVYAMEDQIFKVAAFKKYRAEGMGAKRAAAEVNKWFPNYARTGRLTRMMRKMPVVGHPFVSFVDQSLRIGARAVTDRPIRVAIMAAVPGAVTYLSVMAMGMSPDEKELVDEERSYWEPILPTRDDDGRVMTLDLRYIMPLANDIVPEAKSDDRVFLPWVFQEPLGKTAMEQMFNVDMFTGRGFIPQAKDVTFWEKMSARGAQAAKSALPLPSLAPGGWSFRRLNRAAKGESAETLARAIVGTIIGVNIRKVYVAERHVKDVAKTALLEGDEKLAATIVELWNERYKPPTRKALALKGLKAGLKSSRSYYARRYRDEAAEHILRGNIKKAEESLRTYVEKHPGGKTVTLQDAENQAARFRSQGKTR